MAVQRACWSFRSLLRPTGMRLFTATRTFALQSGGQTCHPVHTLERRISSVNSSDKGAPPYVYNSIVQESFCSNYCRKYGTICREGPDEHGEPSQSLSGTMLDTEPASAMEAPSAQPTNDISFTQIPSVNVAVESAFKSSARHDLAILFTCTVCNVRSAKTMSRATYDTGVVIVRCPGCQNLHLIADRYGWFGEAGSVEDFLAEKGVDVRKGSDSTYEFTVDDMSGWTPKGKSIN